MFGANIVEGVVSCSNECYLYCLSENNILAIVKYTVNHQIVKGNFIIHSSRFSALLFAEESHYYDHHHSRNITNDYNGGPRSFSLKL